MKKILVALLACFAACGTSVASAGDAPFKLLKMEGISAAWKRPKVYGEITLTFALAEQAMSLPKARNCPELIPLDGLLASSHVDRQAFRSELYAAFAMWESAAALRFVEVVDARAADILIGAQGLPLGRAFAEVSTSTPDSPSIVRAGVASRASSQPGSIERAAVCLNPEQKWKIGFDGDLAVYDIRYTLAHEIGHAIGLDHPAAAGALMGYRYDERTSELTPGDVAGAVALYGPAVGSGSQAPLQPPSETAAGAHVND